MISVGEKIAIIWNESEAPGDWKADDLATVIEIEGSDSETDTLEIEFDRDVGGHSGSLFNSPQGDSVLGKRWYITRSEVKKLRIRGQQFPIGRTLSINTENDLIAWPTGCQTLEEVKVLDFSEEEGYLVQFREDVLGHNGRGNSQLRVTGSRSWWIDPSQISHQTPQSGDRVRLTVEIGAIPAGEMGEVLVVEEGRLGIQLDNPHMSLHSCNGRGRIGYCLWVDPTLLEIDFRTPEEMGRETERQAERLAYTPPIYRPGDLVSIPLHVGAEFLPSGFMDEDQATVTDAQDPASIVIEFNRNNGATGRTGRIWTIHQDNLQFVDPDLARTRTPPTAKVVKCPRLREKRGLLPA
jgi:hypothetical protein